MAPSQQRLHGMWNAAPGCSPCAPANGLGHSPALPCPVRALVPSYPILVAGRLYGCPAPCFLPVRWGTLTTVPAVPQGLLCQIQVPVVMDRHRDRAKGGPGVPGAITLVLGTQCWCFGALGLLHPSFTSLFPQPEALDLSAVMLWMLSKPCVPGHRRTGSSWVGAG